MALSPREQAILDFERTWWTEPGTKESRIRQHLDLSPARYYQLLGQIVDREEALDHDPLLVRRLRRLRQRRRRARFDGTSAGERHQP
jgi:hypothetical protein